MNIPDQFSAKLLDGLRSREREVLGLHFFEQFDVQDIAHLLGVKADSVSGHLSKGLASVAKIIGATASDARGVLDAMGETLARSRPKITLTVRHGEEVASVGVLPHREVMGCAVRTDRAATDVTRYFVVDVNGEQLTASAAEHWVREASAAIDLAVRRGLLDAKGIKPTQKFDEEVRGYFFPAGFGCAELYFERDFNHRALVLPLPAGRSVLDHLPPAPIEIARRPDLLPHRWPLRVMDLGQYRADYNEAMSLDAERGMRRWRETRGS